MDYSQAPLGVPVTGSRNLSALLSATNGKIYGSFRNGLFEYDPELDTLRLRAPLQYEDNGSIIGHGATGAMIEICRKPNYKPRATTSFNVCAGAHFFYDLHNVNASPNGVLWRRNGTVVPSQTNQLLEFAAITEGDEGVWTCTLTNECGVTEPPAITITVNAGAFTTSAISGDTLLCGTGDVAVLTGNNGGTWSTGATTPGLNATQPGTYYVYNQQVCGISFSNPFHVTHLDSAAAPPQLYYFGNASEFVGAQICPESPSFIIGDNSGGPWHNQPTGLWQDGSSGPSFTVQDTGYYYISATNACNTDTSNIAHVFYPVPLLPVAILQDAFGQSTDNLLCAGDSVLVYAPAGHYYNVILDGNLVGGAGESNPFVAQTAGTYALVAQPCPSITSDTTHFTIVVDSVLPGTATIIPDQSLITGCDQDTVYLTATEPYCIWTWTDDLGFQQQDTTEVLQVDWSIGNSGVYQMSNYNGCGTGDPDYTQVVGTPAPDVLYAQSEDTLCLSDVVQPLTAGSPAGGTYSGPGVSGTTFSPQDAGIGEHTLTYSYNDGTCTGYAQDVVVVDACLGIGPAQAPAIVVSLVPNPNNGRFSLLITGQFDDGSVILYDALGKRAGSAVPVKQGVNDLEYPSLGAGVYTLRLQVDGRTRSLPFVVVK